MSKELILKADSNLKNVVRYWKRSRSSWFASPDGQLHIATFLLVFPAPR